MNWLQSSSFSLVDVLPPELWHVIFCMLPVESVPSVLQTCKKFHDMIENEHFWKAACRIHLTHLPKDIWRSLFNKPWKETFAIEYSTIHVSFGGKIENKAASSLYLVCPALKGQTVQVPLTCVEPAKVVKRANAFSVPQPIVNYHMLDIQFYVASLHHSAHGQFLTQSPIDRCCERCPENMVSYRTYGFKFDDQGRAQVPVIVNCAPTHNRRSRGAFHICMKVTIGKRTSGVVPLMFKTGKRTRDEFLGGLINEAIAAKRPATTSTPA